MAPLVQRPEQGIRQGDLLWFVCGIITCCDGIVIFRYSLQPSASLLQRSLHCDAVRDFKGGTETTITMVVLPIVTDCNCN